MSTSPALQQDFGQGGQTATTELSTSSLGLLQLLQERGISASRHPHHNLHYSRTGKPSFSTVSDKRGDFFSHKEGRRNIFSWNLVEKLQSLGLHRVAAWGMRGPSDKDREAVRPPPKVWCIHLHTPLSFTIVTLHKAMRFLLCTSVPTTAPVSWKEKPQNVLEPYFQLLVVCSTMFFYELVHGKLFFTCGTFSSQENHLITAVLFDSHFASFYAKRKMMKKRNILYFCVLTFLLQFAPPAITGFKETSSLVILLVSKEKHELCVNNNCHLGKWKKTMCCKLLRVEKPQTNQCCPWKCTKTQSGLPAYSLLCWQKHIVYKFVKLFLERSTEKKPDDPVTELSNVNNIKQSALQSITCSHMHTSISPLSCLKLRLYGLYSEPNLTTTKSDLHAVWKTVKQHVDSSDSKFCLYKSAV